MRTTRNGSMPCVGWAVIVLFGLLWIGAGDSWGGEYVTGRVTSAILLQERLNLTVSDRAVISLGPKDGLIKGDLLVITPGADIGLTNVIAECAVTAHIDEGSSICQITRARMEIQRGNYVSMHRLVNRDRTFYPLFYSTLAGTVSPYEPHRKIAVYIHEIFDENNNVTGLSKRLKKGLEELFSQKSRIRIEKELTVKDFRFYPSHLEETLVALNQVMKRSGLDVFIAGSYTVRGGAVKITLYRFDRHFGNQGAAFRAVLPPDEASEASVIVEPYKPVRKKEYVTARVELKAHQHRPVKDEMGDIIARESDGDAFRKVTLKGIGFNIMSPVDVVVKLDNERLNFAGKDGIIIPAVEKGVHKVSVSFRRGYYSNNRNSLLYTSSRNIEKEITVAVQKDGDLFMEIEMNPAFHEENIAFHLYRQTERRTPLMKSVRNVEVDRLTEYFKD